MSDTPQQKRNLAEFKKDYYEKKREVLNQRAKSRGFKGFKDELEKWLDEHPCPECGEHYDDHLHLDDAEIEEAKKDGYTVSICGVYPNSKHFVSLQAPPEDPCDSDFMEDIST
jgi:hypothetical protein